ncbi:MAG: hypothetical protein ACOH17_04370 [Cellulomonas sp.]
MSSNSYPKVTSRTIREHHADAERLARALATTARHLAMADRDGDLLVAARHEFQVRVQLADLHQWTQRAARTSDDPAALILLHRVQVVGQVLELVRAEHGTALARGWAVLKSDNGWEPDRRGLRHGIRVISGGAPGLGRRA